MPAMDEYRGEKIVVRNNGARCIHSRFCVRGRPDVFKPNVDGPWIDPNALPPETVAAQVTLCPSGALIYQRLDGGAAEKAPGVNSVRVLENGPLAFIADLDIAGDTSSFRATLCRCGQSKNKPFCDHSHEGAAFKATGEAETSPTEPLATPNGRVKVSTIKNGPLYVEGPLEVCAASGRTISRADKHWFCRCGHSNKKPFCDGTHKKMGFTAD